jgi:hypothetical protein
MPELTLEHADFEALAVEILAATHCLRFHASGGSMRPFIWDGDLVELVPSGLRPPRRGDVVLCRLKAGHLALHRVVALRDQAGCAGLVLQGDARLTPDGWFPIAAVLGRAAAVCHAKRRYSLDSPLLRGLAAVWMGLAPLRGGLFGLARFIRAVQKKYFGQPRQL